MSNNIDIGPRKSMFILVVVIGCFSVLWPKVFYPMLVGNANHHAKPSPIDRSSAIRQERPAHLNPDMLHPALRERGRAIPASHTAPRVVEGRPGPIPGMRPPMGGPGHVVPPPTKGTSTMSIVMPIYTIGIVVFFTYTLMKLMFKKPADTTNGLYPPLQPDPNFRKQVFEVDRSQYITRTGKDDGTTKLGWKERDTRDYELNQLRKRLRDTELAMERIVAQMGSVPLKSNKNEVILNGTPPTTISNGHITSLAPDTKEEIIDQKEEIIEKKEEKKLESEKSEEIHEEPENEQTSVKVLGVEITASCEGGQKWSRPNTPLVVSPAPPPPVPEIKPEPQNIFLEGALPPQGQLLVSESATETEIGDDEDENAVVLSGKMTLSVINLDNIDKVVKNGTDFNTIDKEVEDIMDDDELPEESKYTTASNATAAENDCSVDEGHMTDEEELEED